MKNNNSWNIQKIIPFALKAMENSIKKLKLEYANC